VIITINEPEVVNSVKAVGAYDLLNHFLPTIGIVADKVVITEQTENPLIVYSDRADKP
jgi:hypothetical protein